MALWIGLVLFGTALALGAIAALSPGLAVRQGASGSAALRALGQRAADVTDKAMKQRGWSILSVDRLELAGMKIRPGTYAVGVVLVTALLALLGIVLALSLGNPIIWLLVAAIVVAIPLLANLNLAQRTAKRQAKFADQLDDTLQLIASGLRAGHSLARAIDAVSREAESPTSEEFARIINENRLGMDLGEAIGRTATRMKSDDLAWTAQAVDIHREVGGNLSELLDHVAETIRERNNIRRQVATLSAEGRMSANVLMALPFVIALVLLVISPGYLSMFVTTIIGAILLVISAILFIVGAIWLRAITRIKF